MSFPSALEPQLVCHPVARTAEVMLTCGIVESHDHERPPFLDALDVEGFALIQPAGPVHARFGLLGEARSRSMATVDRLLAYATSLCELYAAARWEDTSVPSLRDLFAQHLAEQYGLIASLLERARTLGMNMPRPSFGSPISTGSQTIDCNDYVGWLRRILEVQELGQCELEGMWRQANIDGDRATYDLIVEEVVRINERQSWLIAEQLVRLSDACALRQQGSVR